MSVYKDTKSNTWKVYYRFTDWQGKVHQVSTTSSAGGTEVGPIRADYLRA